MTDKQFDCEYCGAALPKGVDKNTRRMRSAHFMCHAAERQKEESGVHFTAHNTVDKQPESLRLADLMYEKPDSDGNCMKAAAELRRLHALCDEMGEALEAAHHVIGHPDCDGSKARAELIAKWKESK